MLVEKIVERKQQKIRLHPVHANRASRIGDPCERRLVFERTRWEEASLYDVGLQFIFDEGHLQETQVVKDLMDAGWTIIEQQRDYEWREYQITAHLDGKVVHYDGQPTPPFPMISSQVAPFEVKSMNPFTFKQINTADDILRSKKAYVRAYAAQMQIYLLLSNSDRGVFIIKDKSSGQLKEIWMNLDYEFAESLIKKAERINRHVSEGTIPDPIPWDESICGRCPFAHICLPEARRDALDLTDDPDLEAKLRRRAELAPLYSEYKELDDEVKAAFKERPKVVCGSFIVTGRWQDRKDDKKVWLTKIDQLTTKGVSDE